QTNLANYIASGRRVVLTGENAAWASWNNSILAPVGGSYTKDNDTFDRLTPRFVHPLTAGVSRLQTIFDGLANISARGTSLFNENVVTLWSDSQSVLSILSVDVI